MKKTNKRAPPSPPEDDTQPPKAQCSNPGFVGGSILPKRPGDIEDLVTRKYTIADKDKLQTHSTNIHECVMEHFDFWERVFDIKSLCEDHILYINSKRLPKSKANPRLLRLVYTTIEIKRLMKTFLVKYQRWRWADGCFIGSPSMTRCCAGHAHGWTAIDRIYILESNIFFSLNYHTKKKMMDREQLTKEEIASMIDKRRHILLHVETPVHQWSARMIILQLRLISQRWNHLKNIVSDKNFRTGLWKLMMQIQYRSYMLINHGTFTPDLQAASSILDEGVLSANFNGKIICTPQTNCGMSSIVSKGSWLDNLVMSCSKIITKIQNCLILLDRMCPHEKCVTIDYAIDKSPAFKNYAALHAKFSAMINAKSAELLDSGQIQEQLSVSLCVSLIGIDVMVRKTDQIGITDESDGNYHTKARNVAPTGMCLWLDSYLKNQKKDYIIESELASVLIDMKEIAMLHTFETISKKEGNNDMGFIKKFFIRLETIRDDGDLVMTSMSTTSTPFIMKTGAHYVVGRAGKQHTIHCETIVDAIVAWACILEHYNQWKVGKFNFSSVYRPIFYI